MKCKQCDLNLSGPAEVIGEAVIHTDCKRRYVAALNGRHYGCPVCGTRGTVDDEKRPVTERRREEPPACAWDGCRGCAGCIGGTPVTVGYQQKSCGLCDGFGWTKTEPKPVTQIVGYRL